MDRNHPLLGEIAKVLRLSATEQTLLSQHFRQRLVVDAGSEQTVATFAKELRLSISAEECSQVLDHIARKAMIGITIEHVDEAINALFNNRFIEPEQKGDLYG